MASAYTYGNFVLAPRAGKNLCVEYFRRVSTLLELTMFSRMFIAITAYVLSSVGILMMCQLIKEELGDPKPSDVFIFVWLIAWFVHAVMTVAWVRDRKLPRLWPVSGTLAGLGSFMLWPLLAVESGSFALDAAVTVQTVGTLVTIQFVLVSPCILLAVWLVRFHIKTTQPIPASSNNEI